MVYLAEKIVYFHTLYDLFNCRILEVLCRDLRLTSEFDFQFLAHNSPGFVGADLMALTREAAMTAVNRYGS